MPTKTDIYKKTFTEDDAPGLDAINNREKEIYGAQEPTHLATVVPYELGGEDPLWAINYYISEKQKRHFHYITLGFTNLFYNEEFAEDEVNGFGFELTFRHLPVKKDPEKPHWAANFLTNLSKYVFNSKNGFDDFHYMSANGPIRLDTKTNITAMVFYTDPEMQELDTPHGKMKFLQIFGITTHEYQDLRNEKYTVEELLNKHRQTNPLLITDLTRGQNRPWWKFS
ncbi:suppressor of fused domain protein [Polluticaenibacter yanchengensis]|uniref:Suppressor of fused domain protein n=1 Tax=Polluticaenibacter yanchengensis TaxID=3014562 RepID=A0ABT4UHV4_9BACT|nr:suppressor of fused domain protein [Chitinophagaceae bacterium LY-5]